MSQRSSLYKHVVPSAYSLEHSKLLRHIDDQLILGAVDEIDARTAERRPKAHLEVDSVGMVSLYDFTKRKLFKTAHAVVDNIIFYSNVEPGKANTLLIPFTETVFELSISEDGAQDALIYKTLKAQAHTEYYLTPFQEAFTESALGLISKLLTDRLSLFSTIKLMKKPIEFNDSEFVRINQVARLTLENLQDIQNTVNHKQTTNTNTSPALMQLTLLKIAKIASILDLQPDSGRLIDNLASTLQLLSDAGIIDAKWHPYLMAIPPLRKTEFGRTLLKGNLNYNVYMGISPVELLLYSADAKIYNREYGAGYDIIELWLKTFNEMVSAGMNSDELLDLMTDGARLKRVYPPLFSDKKNTDLPFHYAVNRYTGAHYHEFQEWEKNSDLVNLFKGWGGFKLIAPNSYFTSVVDDVVHACTKDYEVPDLSAKVEGILEAMNTFENVKQHVSTRKSLYDILNWLPEAKTGQLQVAAERLLKAGFLSEPWAAESGRSLFNALLAGPYFESDRTASTLSEENVLIHVLFNMPPDVSKDAFAAGHSPLREIRLTQAAKSKTFLTISSSSNLLLGFIQEEHPSHDYESNKAEIVLGTPKSFLLNNASWFYKEANFMGDNALIADLHETLQAILEEDDAVLTDKEVDQILLSPSFALAGLNANVVRFGNPKSLKHLTSNQWLSNNGVMTSEQLLVILESIIQRASNDGVTPSTDVMGGLSFESVIQSAFGDPGAALLNKVHLSGVMGDSARVKRNRL